MEKYDYLKESLSSLNILIVENDPSSKFNSLKSLSPTILFTKSYLNGLNIFKEHNIRVNNFFDVVIIDIDLSYFGAIKFLKNIYKYNRNQSIVVYSNTESFKCAVLLLNLQVDYFIRKETKENIFLKKILNISKEIKNKIKKDTNILELNRQLFWDLDKHELIENSICIPLTKYEILFFETFLKKTKSVVTNDELIYAIWDDEIVDDRNSLSNLKNLISRVRKKVPSLKIKNVYGMGYKLIF